MDKYQQAALDFANNVRKELGLPPVDKLYAGEHSAYSCAITNTIKDDDLDKTVSTIYNQSRLIENFVPVRFFFSEFSDQPELVTTFIHRFDMHRYPDLCGDEGAFQYQEPIDTATPVA